MTYSKTQQRQIMATITNIILKIKPMIKKPILANHALFLAVSFSNPAGTRRPGDVL